MKKLILFLAVLGVLLQSQGAFAKTLEDVLKEKGVITEEDYKEVTKSKPFNYQIGKGFTMTTPDEKFQLTLGGRVQFRYTFTDFDVNNSAKSDMSQWDAKRIRMIAQGYAFSKDLTYKLEFDPRVLAAASPGNSKGLIETYLNYRLIDEVQIKVGQMKTPFARQEITSDGQLQFVDRSIVVDAFKPTYDIGAMLNGKIADGLVYYYAGVYGGAGQSTVRNSNDNMVVARIAVNPLGDMPYSEGDLEGSVKPLLSVGANYFRNTVNKSAAIAATPTIAATAATLDITNPNYAATPSATSTTLGNGGWLGRGFAKSGFAANGIDKIDVDSYGADLAFKWLGLSLQGEYLLGEAEAHSNGHLLRAQGFYAQAGYCVIPKTLEFAFRYSYLDPDRDVSNNNLTEVIGGVSYYFNKHNLKLQADVGDIHDQNNRGVNGTKTDDMQYRAQVQLIF